MLSIRECFAQALQRSDNLLIGRNRNKEGLAFADRVFCDEFKNCGANANPLQFSIIYKQKKTWKHFQVF